MVAVMFAAAEAWINQTVRCKINAAAVQ